MEGEVVDFQVQPLADTIFLQMKVTKQTKNYPR